MSNRKTIMFLMLAVALIYVGSIPVPEKCDMLESGIDKLVYDAGGTKEILYGKMTGFSYFRQKLATDLKNLYDNTDCSDF